MGLGSAVRERCMSNPGDQRRRPHTTLLAALFGALLLVSAASALAQTGDDSSARLPTSQDVMEAIESVDPSSIAISKTDPEAAQALPHEDLGRAEALELLTSVFDAPLKAPVGIFDDLQVDRFLAKNVAVAESDDAELAAAEDSSASNEGDLSGSELLVSTIPLGVHSSAGGLEAVDLDLERAGEDVSPVNPLVDVSIPTDLGDGIEVSGTGVTIRLPDAPEDRSPSLAEDSVAFLPNVALDTDLAIVPTPTGVKTFTQVRSPESPRSQTFEVDLPPGAHLRGAENGGAVVVDEDEPLVGISAPTAIDATGADVPVTLDVEGSSFTLTIAPDGEAIFPVLVDPLIQNYEWMAKNTTAGIPMTTGAEGWSPERVESDNQLPFGVRLENRNYATVRPVPMETPGLFLESSKNESGKLTAGDRGSFMYTVPRYFSDYEKFGQRPTSFISQMTLSGLDWNAFSDRMSPYLFAGIWDPIKPGWVSSYSHEGLVGHGVHDMSWQYRFPSSANTNTNVKVGYVSIQATETGVNQHTNAYVGSASLQLADSAAPGSDRSLAPPLGSTSRRAHWASRSATPASGSHP